MRWHWKTFIWKICLWKKTHIRIFVFATYGLCFIYLSETTTVSSYYHVPLFYSFTFLCTYFLAQYKTKNTNIIACIFASHCFFILHTRSHVFRSTEKNVHLVFCFVLTLFLVFVWILNFAKDKSKSTFLLQPTIYTFSWHLCNSHSSMSY